MPLALELVSTVEAFERIGPAWNALVDRMEFPEIFYRWEWSFLFFRHCRPDDELFIVVAREASDGSIAAIAPLCIRHTRSFGVAVKVAETIVTGLADYQNVLVREGVHRGRAIDEILAFLGERTDRWDVLDLQQFCSRDPTTFQLVNAAQSRHHWTVRTHILTPVAVRNLRPGKATEDTDQLRRIRGRLAVLRTRGADLRLGCEDFAACWPAFRELHVAAWPGSPLGREKEGKFFDALVASKGMRKYLDLSLLLLDGRLAAGHFGFVDERKAYYYMPARDRSFRSERVGAALLFALVEHHARSRTWFDFMRTLGRYKTWYTDTIDVNFRIVVHGNSSGRALAYGLSDVTRRFLVELGLPRAVLRRLARRRS
jgi:CelD/BcsL family acetyltransferase involved in cellulose biosynthesis